MGHPGIHTARVTPRFKKDGNSQAVYPENEKGGTRFCRIPPGISVEVRLVAVPPTTAVTSEFTTTTAGGTFLAGLGHIHRESASAKLPAMQTSNGRLGFFGAVHGHKGKPTGAVRHAIHHQIGFRDRTVRGKRVLKVVFGGVKGKVSYE